MKKNMRDRMMVALDQEPFSPSQEQRDMVRVWAFNGTPRSVMARILNITELQLTMAFQHELELSNHEILGQAALNMLALASQTKDLGVALRANELLLKTRLASWREPKQTETPPDQQRLEDLSNEELEAIIARAVKH